MWLAAGDENVVVSIIWLIGAVDRRLARRRRRKCSNEHVPLNWTGLLTPASASNERVASGITPKMTQNDNFASGIPIQYDAK